MLTLAGSIQLSCTEKLAWLLVKMKNARPLPTQVIRGVAFCCTVYTMY